MSQYSTVEPRYEKVPRDWQNLFAITRFCYIEVLFHVLPLLGVKKIVCYTEDLNLERTSLYGGSTLLPHGKKILLIFIILYVM